MSSDNESVSSNSNNTKIKNLTPTEKVDCILKAFSEVLKQEKFNEVLKNVTHLLPKGSSYKVRKTTTDYIMFCKEVRALHKETHPDKKLTPQDLSVMWSKEKADPKSKYYKPDDKKKSPNKHVSDDEEIKEPKEDKKKKVSSDEVQVPEHKVTRDKKKKKKEEVEEIEEEVVEEVVEEKKSKKKDKKKKKEEVPEEIFEDDNVEEHYVQIEEPTE